ncbi:MAG: hypothetical protein Q4B09_11070 [Lachnospiraceae bacterium]|nr:hypothetical protein [Lachnospiraceae bacterium]
MKRRWISLVLSGILGCSLAAGMPLTAGASETFLDASDLMGAADAEGEQITYNLPVTDEETKAYIEDKLNLKKNAEQEWTWLADAGAWVLSVTPAVAFPEIEEAQGVSVCVPGAYVIGIDTDGDGQVDMTAADAGAAVRGALVIDYESSVTSPNGQVYTAATAPLILNTGAAGYSEQQNRTASPEYAAYGYINIACGNRGKQSMAVNEEGDVYYTGDAPSCLVDQKNAARFVRYNIYLGNLPGSPDYLVTTGGSGGGAHAAMFAATSEAFDFFAYEADAGAVGVYRVSDQEYSETVSVDGQEYRITDGAWGCIAYSAVTPLKDADAALAFEYSLDPDYSFNTEFQKQLASSLAQAYMQYINEKDISVSEESFGVDIDGDGKISGEVSLTIEYNEELYPETNGYGGTYLNLYLGKCRQNLQWYLDNLDYASDWTWFDAEGKALSDEAVAAMTTADKAAAFLEGRYAKSEAQGFGGPGGRPDGMNGELPVEGYDREAADAEFFATDDDMSFVELTDEYVLDTEEAGTPEEGTTQAAGSETDSLDYESFDELLEAYQTDVAEVEAGDKYGNDITDLYDPLGYIVDGRAEKPVWTRIVTGAAEGDISLFSSMNLQAAWLGAGVDSVVEWQWDGGHVPSEIFGNSFGLYVDQMYGKYVEGAVEITKPAAEKQTVNGTAAEPNGTDISSWVQADDLSAVSFSLAAAAAYRTAVASKAIPAFDVLDYGQEDYVFGNAERDARHWSRFVLEALEANLDVLGELFNGGTMLSESELIAAAEAAEDEAAQFTEDYSEDLEDYSSDDDVTDDGTDEAAGEEDLQGEESPDVTDSEA